MLLDPALALVLAAIFLLSGATKLAGVRRIAAQFKRWGYPPSVRLAGGVLEALGAFLLLFPDFTLYGVLVLLGVLVTAIYTHVVRERIPRNGIGAALLMGLVILLGLIRGPETASVGGVVFRALFG